MSTINEITVEKAEKIAERFEKDYNGLSIEDEGSVCSKSYKDFHKKMTTNLRSFLKILGGSVVKSSCNHYDSTFIIKIDDSLIYIYYSNSMRTMVDLHNMMYRTMSGVTDYHGGNNNFTKWSMLPREISHLIKMKK